MLCFHAPAGNSLRSSNANLLTVPFARTLGARSFSVASLKIWNSLPPALRSCNYPDTSSGTSKITSSMPFYPLGISPLRLRFGICWIVRVYKFYILTAIVSKTISNWTSWHLWQGTNAGWRCVGRMYDEAACTSRRVVVTISPIDDWCIPLDDGASRAYRVIGLAQRCSGWPDCRWAGIGHRGDRHVVVSGMLLRPLPVFSFRIGLETFSAVDGRSSCVRR